MDEKRFRFDLFVAVCALLLSGLAAGASAYQTYIINQQYQASIWPYLGFSLSSNNRDLISLTVRNYGLGPALVRSYDLTRNGRHLRSFNDAITAYEQPNDGNATIDVVSIGQGTIIPAAESFTLLRVQNAKIVKRVIAHQSEFDLSICYCSLLGRCWMRHLQDPTDQPHDIRVCPLPAGPRPRMFGP